MPGPCRIRIQPETECNSQPSEPWQYLGSLWQRTGILGRASLLAIQKSGSFQKIWAGHQSTDQIKPNLEVAEVHQGDLQVVRAKFKGWVSLWCSAHWASVTSVGWGNINITPPNWSLAVRREGGHPLGLQCPIASPTASDDWGHATAESQKDFFLSSYENNIRKIWWFEPKLILLKTLEAEWNQRWCNP